MIATSEVGVSERGCVRLAPVRSGQTFTPSTSRTFAPERTNERPADRPANVPASQGAPFATARGGREREGPMALFRRTDAIGA
jgi:hypothetical protein